MSKPLAERLSFLLPKRLQPVPVAANGTAPGLTATQRESWARDGYLLLRGVLSRAEIASISDLVDRQWDNPDASPYEVDVLTGPNSGSALRISALPEGSRQQAYKLNNLFAREVVVRQVSLTPRLRGILADLLEGEPLICNSLNFERGSQQEFHIDSWYMPAPNEGCMVAASIALESIDGENGPMAFYPGSHLIPPYRFSDGRVNEIGAESAKCRAYLDQEIAERGLIPQEVHAEAGDVFVWHAQLLHSGSPIRDFDRTRKSMVVHYWRTSDLPGEHVRRDENGAYLGHTLRGELQH